MFASLKKYFEAIHPPSDEEWKAFEQLLSIMEFEKGANLTRGGQVENHLYFIAKGGVRLFYLKEGKEYATSFRFENEFASSYSSFLLRTPSRMYVQAIEPTTVLAMHYDNLQGLYEHSNSFLL